MTNEIIAELNDKFRRLEDRSLARYMMTAGVQTLALEEQLKLVQLVRDFDCFTADNDPYGEHDFGKVVLDGEGFCWKIDYYDLDMKYLSNNPAEESLTKRVMTIMRSNEY